MSDSHSESPEDLGVRVPSPDPIAGNGRLLKRSVSCVLLTTPYNASLPGTLYPQTLTCMGQTFQAAAVPPNAPQCTGA